MFSVSEVLMKTRDLVSTFTAVHIPITKGRLISSTSVNPKLTTSKRVTLSPICTKRMNEAPPEDNSSHLKSGVLDKMNHSLQTIHFTDSKLSV